MRVKKSQSSSRASEATPAEAALRDSEARLQLALRAARMGTWDWDLVTGRILWSEIHEELWGMRPGSFRGTYMEFEERLHPDDREALQKATREALANGTEYNCEYRIVLPDGRVRWIAGRGHGVYDADGTALRMTGIVMDITERHEAEAARETAQAQVRDSERMLRGILDSMFAFVGVFTVDGILVDSNRAPLEAAGLKREDVIGKPVIDTFWINHSPQAQAQLSAAIDRAARGETVREDLEIRVGNGSLIVLDTTLGPLFDAEGRIVRIVGSGVDVSARKHAESMRQKFEARLWESQKMEALGTLAGGVAHDFNNILSIIIGNAELAHQDVGERHAASTSLDEIRKAGRRAKNIVQQILAYSRKQPLQRRALALRPIVEECAVMLRATLPSGATLNVDCEDAPNVLADATQIHQVLLNLGANAFHAIAHDAQSNGIVTLRLRRASIAPEYAARHDGLTAGEYAVLTVEDNGLGIDAATRQRIFEPFFTTKAPGKGTGLGLAVVDGIVRAHGGVAIVESELGAGTKFHVYLPVADAHETASAAQSNAGHARGRGQRILYLDDDASLVSLTSKLLERANYRVSGFTDAAAALDALRANPENFDLAITDHTMPAISGLQVARLMRAIRPNLRVVLVSGYVTDDLRQRAHDAGVRHVAFKPDNGDELSAIVELALSELVPGS
jgi:PAS domain S-box-containing protein